MMLLDMVPAGERRSIGSYDFSANRIIEFASQFDPQVFHLDEQAAKQSLFGGLCASGWHVCSASMKGFVAFLDEEMAKVTARGEAAPKPGPSPGFRNLKWLRPVFAGDRVNFFLTILSSDPIANRPGRNMVQMAFEGVNQNGEPVLSYTCAMIEFA